jgi:Cdc6-like AAA superfamily ATPase
MVDMTCLSDSDDEGITIMPRRVTSSSSTSKPIINRGNPDFIQARDTKNMSRFGTTVTNQPKPIRMNAPPGELAVAATIPAEEPMLSAQQSDILTRILVGESFFFTGSAGTGKSVLLRAIVKAFASKKRSVSHGQSVGVVPYELGITASTGMAAM